MPDPEDHNPNQIIHFSETLRDTVWNFLPANASRVKALVVAEYIPVDNRRNLKMKVGYTALDNLQIIELDETLSFQPKEDGDVHTFSLLQHIEVGADTGKIVEYIESGVVEDDYGNTIGPDGKPVNIDALLDKGLAAFTSALLGEKTEDAPEEEPVEVIKPVFTQDKLNNLLGLFETIHHH